MEIRNVSGKSEKIANYDDSNESQDGAVARGNWSGKLEFLLSCLTFAVGLGNIWRFPYLCYRNGGGAFLIPYLLFVALCAMPLFFLEVAIGQFGSLSPIATWKLSPLFKGLGYSMTLLAFVVNIYYNVIVAWTIYFIFASFTWTLPWSTCGNSWNTPQCSLIGQANTTSNGTVDYLLKNFTAYKIGNINVSVDVAENGSTLVNTTLRRVSPSEEYWSRYVLNITEGIEDMGSVQWKLLPCLAAAWMVVFLCIIKGIRTSGKVVYFTATFPYLILTILLIRGVTLPGAADGLKYYLIPKWEKLGSFKVWGEAAMQIFYSSGVGWGAVGTMASYNTFNNNCHRDSVLIPIMNAGTSLFAGLVIFSIVGFMAHETGESIENVVTQGPGLAFVVYPEAVTKLPAAPVWSVLFFTMVLTVGIGSQFTLVQSIAVSVVDEFNLSSRKVLVTAILCIVEFVLGLPMIMQGGMYVLQVMDWYAVTFVIMIVAFTECVAVAWIYGMNQFSRDIELMIGFKPCLWWKMCWRFLTPGLVLFIFCFIIITHVPVTYGDYTYPDWAIGVGWILAVVSFVPIPEYACYRIYNTDASTFVQRLRLLRMPEPSWGPSLEKNRELYISTLDERVKRHVLGQMDLDTASIPLKQ
ncbi:unnamed protein product [Owenia fusiformis]|uniref:Transporter n=1 Tax=Owenia fusiformis TaxID=6347 RepID=A0A8J1THQ3_OWEFU|nr:unnamed protein product [Owenia fusiformis]